MIITTVTRNSGAMMKPEDPRESQAAKLDLNYVWMKYHYVNGAGLAMATMTSSLVK